MTVTINIPSQLPALTGNANLFLRVNAGENGIEWAATAGGGITIGTTAIASGAVNRVLFEGAGNVVQQNAAFVWNNTDNRLILGTESSADTNSRLVVIGKGTGTNNTFAVHNSTGNNNSLIVRDDGRVGIGTNAPLARLHIEGGVSEVGGEHTLIVRSSSPSTIPTTVTCATSNGVLQIFAGSVLAGASRGGQIDFCGGTSTNAGVLSFRTGTASGGTSQPERMRLTAAGSLFIFGAGTLATPSFLFSATSPISTIVTDANGNIGIGTAITTVAKVTIDAPPLINGSRSSIFLPTTSQTDLANISGNSTGGVAISGGALSAGAFRGAQISLYGGNHATLPGIMIFRTGNASGGTEQTERMRLTINGNLLIGTTTDNPRALLNLTSNEKGLLVPRLTTTERNAVTWAAGDAGMIIYNTTDNQFQGWNGTTWNNL
jgi:hypothetical protein